MVSSNKNKTINLFRKKVIDFYRNHIKSYKLWSIEEKEKIQKIKEANIEKEK